MLPGTLVFLASVRQFSGCPTILKAQIQNPINTHLPNCFNTSHTKTKSREKGIKRERGDRKGNREKNEHKAINSPTHFQKNVTGKGTKGWKRESSRAPETNQKTDYHLAQPPTKVRETGRLKGDSIHKDYRESGTIEARPPSKVRETEKAV